MAIVLVDASGITLALVGAVSPQAVQIVITGLTVGQSIVVTGSAGGFSWQVRGGTTMARATQMVLADTAAPINVPITYTVTVDGVAFVVGPITVPHADSVVLQSLDGRTSIPAVLQANGLPTDIHLRSVGFEVAGRADRPGRWDVSSGEAGELLVRMSRPASDALRAHLRTSAPVLLLRTDGTIRDLPPVMYLRLTKAASQMWDSVTVGQMSTERLWALGFEVAEDPEPEMLLPATTGQDFDAAWAGRTWADFDAEMSGLTGDDFDAMDWAQYA